MMRTSPRGIEDLVLSEGIRLTAYKDSVGVWTIGVGHAATSRRAPIPKAGMRITRQQAFDILAKDLAEAYEPAVRKALGNVPQHVFDGAVSFHFNTGAIGRASWVKKYRAGDMAGARKAFMQWNKPPEIIGRRTREAELIFEGRYRSTAPAAPAPVPHPIPTSPVDDPMPVPPIDDAPEKTPLTFILGVGLVFIALAAFAVLKFLGKI